MELKKVYAVVHEKTVCNNSCDVTISDAYVSRNDAKKKMAELKSQIINNWKSRDASTYKIGVDNDGIFDIHETHGGDIEWVYINEIQIISNQNE